MSKYNHDLIKNKMDDYNYSAWDLAEVILELEEDNENLKDRLSEKEDTISELHDTIDEMQVIIDNKE